MTPIYEDNHIIIVSKQSGEIVQGDKTGDTPLSETVKDYIKVKYQKPGNVFLGVVHRLDRPVSGLVMFARTSKALARLNDMFRVGDIHKTYWAIVPRISPSRPLPPPSPVGREPEGNNHPNLNTSANPNSRIGSLPTEGSPMLITSEYVKSGGRGHLIAIAKDSAFNFTYRANIDALRELGEIIFFSPLNDERMPDCDLLYLPGGYPELFASDLTNNASMRESIKAFAERGGRIFAECGGFMYLCNDIDGIPMCGVFPFSATMMDAKLHLGYRQLCNTKLSTLNPKLAKGHEFHYSSVIEPDIIPDGIVRKQCQMSAKGKAVDTALYHYKNVLAGYTHWYWAETGFTEIMAMFQGRE